MIESPLHSNQIKPSPAGLFVGHTFPRPTHFQRKRECYMKISMIYNSRVGCKHRLGSLIDKADTADSFPLSTSAFVRTSKNSDQNAFERLVKISNLSSGGDSSSEPAFQKFTSSRAANVTIDDAIVVIAVYNKVSWNPSFVARLSQHAFLSSQTLQDVCSAIPCAPYATQVSSHSSVQTYEIEDPRPSCNVICIEGVAYGEGGEDDHSRY